MTREEAIEILIAEAVCASPILSCDFCARCVVMGNHCTHPTDKEVEEAVLLLKGASNDMAISALRQQEQEGNDWICTLKCTALMEEGMCAHGGLCCLHESQRIIQEKEPLTLDELRQMDGEPVWICFIDGVVMRDDGWFILALLNESQSILEGKHPVYKNLEVYGKTWLAYRQKPEEVMV